MLSGAGCKRSSRPVAEALMFCVMNSRIITTVLLVCLVAGCSNHRLPPHGGSPSMSDWDIYHHIKLGMSQSEVEKVVGKPHAPVSLGLAFYGGPPVPTDAPPGSRSVPFNILIVYSNMVVVSKVIYARDDVYHEGEYPIYIKDDKETKRPKRKGSIANEKEGRTPPW